MLPKNLFYQNKVESAAAMSYTAAIQPLNGTGSYTAGNSIIINIPTTPNTVLVPSECYLKFDVIVTSVAANPYIRLDKAGAHGVIQRLRVTHGSQELENLDNYGALAAEMIALQQSGDGVSGKLNILNGNCNALYAGATNREVTMSNVGERFTQGANSQYTAIANAAVCNTRTFSINLMSLVGSLGGSHYIPLFEMTSAPLCVTIQLVDNVMKFVNSQLALASAFTVQNCEFIGSFIQLSDQSIATIRNSLQGQPLQYVIQSYANYSNTATIAATATSVTHQIAAKYCSLRSLFCVMRSATAAAGAATFFPYSSTHFNLSDWRIRIGSQFIPSKAPSTMAEHYSELLKAIGSLSDINHEPSINWYTYVQDATPQANVEIDTRMDATTRSDCFALGLDLESYYAADKDRIFSGMDTRTSDIFWALNFTGVAGGISARFDYYALYDNVLVFENGVCRSVR